MPKPTATPGDGSGGAVGCAVLRIAVLSALLLPFVVLAVKDGILHLNARPVPVLESVLHAVLALAILGMASGAFRDDMLHLAIAGAVFTIAGVLDEFVYHHDIPIEEHSVHAKQHLTLMLFVVTAVLWHVLA